MNDFAAFGSDLAFAAFAAGDSFFAEPFDLGVEVVEVDIIFLPLPCGLILASVSRRDGLE